jgi:predicted GNAT family acetyltransferase
MIKAINANNKAEVINYLMEELFYNIYILGDIELYGIGSSEVSLYTNDDIKNIKFVLMSYLGDYVLYSLNCDFDADEVAQFIFENKVKLNYCISGKGDAIDKLFCKMPNTLIRKTTLALYEGEYLYSESNPNLKELSMDDSQDLLDLYLLIDEFSDKYKTYTKKQMRNVFYGGHVIGLYSDSGQLVASASSTAESSFSAMITNVCVHPLYRNKKLASYVLKKLINTLLELEIKNICLYYDNPFAAMLYRKFGFIEKGIYKTLKSNINE